MCYNRIKEIWPIGIGVRYMADLKIIGNIGKRLVRAGASAAAEKIKATRAAKRLVNLGKEAARLAFNAARAAAGDFTGLVIQLGQYLAKFLKKYGKKLAMIGLGLMMLPFFLLGGLIGEAQANFAEGIFVAGGDSNSIDKQLNTALVKEYKEMSEKSVIASPDKNGKPVLKSDGVPMADETPFMLDFHVLGIVERMVFENKSSKQDREEMLKQLKPEITHETKVDNNFERKKIEKYQQVGQDKDGNPIYAWVTIQDFNEDPNAKTPIPQPPKDVITKAQTFGSLYTFDYSMVTIQEFTVDDTRTAEEQAEVDTETRVTVQVKKDRWIQTNASKVTNKLKLEKYMKAHSKHYLDIDMTWELVEKYDTPLEMIEEGGEGGLYAIEGDFTYSGGELEWPVPGYTRISSPFGVRVHPILKTEKFHDGVDIPAPTGAEVLAVEKGQVIYAGPQTGYGETIVIFHGNLNGSNIYTLYAHLSSIDIQLNQQVERGTHIGKVGSTGMSTGPHLHFSVRVGSSDKDHAVDPVKFFNASGGGSKTVPGATSIDLSQYEEGVDYVKATYPVPGIHDDDELMWFLKVVQAEWDTSIEGQVAVANVILYRAYTNRTSIKNILFSKGQFSCIDDGRAAKQTPSEKTKNAVQTALNGYDFSGAVVNGKVLHAYFFHNPYTSTAGDADDRERELGILRKYGQGVMAHVFMPRRADK